MTDAGATAIPRTRRKIARPAIRLKAPREGATAIADHVQGTVTVANQQLDDLIILRADGTPTYNLSVVVDDHDMAMTHVIRGDDHFNNAFRQTQIYRALGWDTPEFAHVPLIHGPDGAKLSKRHGALGIDAYRDMGYLPEALQELSAAARLEPRRRRDHLDRRGDRAGSTSTPSAARRRGSISPSSTTSTRITSARPPMRASWHSPPPSSSSGLAARSRTAAARSCCAPCRR